eukprot:1188176-Prorocentrum_minimum.AAC.2
MSGRVDASAGVSNSQRPSGAHPARPVQEVRQGAFIYADELLLICAKMHLFCFNRSTSTVCIQYVLNLDGKRNAPHLSDGRR